MSQPSLYPKHLKTLAIAAVVFSATWIFSNTAQSGEVDLNFIGSVTSNTCVLRVTDSTDTANATTGSATVTGTRNIQLPKAVPTPGASAATKLGSEVTISLSLVANANSTATCTLTSPTSWNVVLDIDSSQIASASGKSFVINSTTGTGAATGVGLFFMTAAGADLSLTGTQQARVNGLSTGVTGSTPLSFKAQLVTTSASTPTSGAFTAKVPLLVVYQ